MKINKLELVFKEDDHGSKHYTYRHKKDRNVFYHLSNSNGHAIVEEDELEYIKDLAKLHGLDVVFGCNVNACTIGRFSEL